MMSTGNGPVKTKVRKGSRRGCGNLAAEVRIENLNRKIEFHEKHIAKASSQLVNTIAYHEKCRSKLRAERERIASKPSYASTREWYRNAEKAIARSGKSVEELLSMLQNDRPAN